MKTFFKILAVLIILVIALAILLPIIFKGKIVEIAKKEINSSVNAKVDFSSIDLSLFRSFPHFSLGINDLSITGKEEFETDTLANIGAINVTIDLFSVIQGNNYEIKRIAIANPDIHVVVLENGKANYDIALPSETPETEPAPESEGSTFVLTLNQVEITNGNIRYNDAGLDMRLVIAGLNHKLSGNFTEDLTMLKTNTQISSFTLNYSGIDYLKNATLSYKADIEADLKNEIYTLSNNEMKLNELFLVFDGSVSMIEEDINLVLTFNAPKTEFKHILSMVQAVYAKDFASVETTGSLALSGNVKGIYNETNLPAFQVNLDVADAMFKYPELPQAVTDINISTKISNKGGDADNTIIDLSKFHLNLGGNTVDMKMLIKTPVSDPAIDGFIKGEVDLANVGKFYPLEPQSSLSGSVTADITLAGKLSAIENEEYENFTAIGSMLIKGLKYESEMVNEPVEISVAQLNFSPAYLDLVSFKTKIGKNDFQAKGKLENYLAYYLKNDVLKGELTTRSEYFNVSSLMPEETTEVPEETNTDTIPMSVVEVPANIHFTMASTFGELIYDNIVMQNVSGRIEVADQKITLNNLSMNLLDGEMVVNGHYSTVNPQQPEVDFNLNLKEVDIQKAYNTFGMMEKYAPIAEKTSGKFSTKMDFKTTLDETMMPVYESIAGNGELSTSTIQIQNVNSLTKIADALKMDKLKSMDISKILLTFKIIDGKLLVDPFDIKYNDYNANIGGWTALDQTIDYKMDLAIPRAEFGSAANDMLNSLVNQANQQGTNFSLGETVNIGILIGGTLTDPEIKTALKESGKTLVEDVKEQIKEEIEKKKEEITQEARERAQKILDDADKQAQKLVSEAEKQAAQVRKNAADAAQKLRAEADTQAKKVEAEGKKKGFLAEAAAKESAKKIRQEADKQANNLTNEADKQANDMVNKAKQQADKIRQDAQKEADKILGK
jgi:vacuolar-type H+-ATPase subunit E/Vma4